MFILENLGALSNWFEQLLVALIRIGLREAPNVFIVYFMAVSLDADELELQSGLFSSMKFDKEQNFSN